MHSPADTTLPCHIFIIYLCFVQTMQFNVPYIPDSAYTTFLAGLGDMLHSVHYSLSHPLLNDGRVRMATMPAAVLTEQLSRLAVPQKYLLANGRFHQSDNYLRSEQLAPLIEDLNRLVEAGCLTGIVFSDSYLLLALAEQAPRLVANIQAVPSINFVIDAVDKVGAVLALVEAIGFRLPEKLPLDRALNRQPKKLARLVAHIRKRWPRLKIELLANEGCLPQCPFRATHEALIAAANSGFSVDTLAINQRRGCVQLLERQPHRILSSPFIRPEDVAHFHGVVDIIKICGRSLGRGFLLQAVQSYATGESPKNLLSLLDAANWMANRWELPSKTIPEDFYEQLTGCAGECSSCHYCEKLFSRTVKPLPFRLKDLREQ
jgi:collagenase-like PrtC family protease